MQFPNFAEAGEVGTNVKALFTSRGGAVKASRRLSLGHCYESATCDNTLNRAENCPSDYKRKR